MPQLTFVGLGLWDEDDVSVRGLEAIRTADTVLAEWYTAFLAGASPQDLEEAYGQAVEVLDRQGVEQGTRVLDAAREGDAVFLTAGDAMTATTHVDLRLQAEAEGIETRVIPGASVVTAVPGLLGLQSYKFGRGTTLVFPRGSYFPTSPYDVVAANKTRGLHTLVLLDIKRDEDRYMTASEGVELLLRMEEERGEGVVTEDTVVAGVARAGSPEPVTAAGPAREVAGFDFGPPLHAVVVPGEMHFVESQALRELATWLGEPGAGEPPEG